jgi:hypothetical protein
MWQEIFKTAPDGIDKGGLYLLPTWLFADRVPVSFAWLPDGALQLVYGPSLKRTVYFPLAK